MIRRLTILIFLCLAAQQLRADSYSDYIERYTPVALEQQEKWGIPACITLAQGLLESGAGRSTLAREGNNHFGIKCHKDWKGETMLRSDDAPDECFRVYSSDQESYEDHSRFLNRSRYSSLFLLDPADYAGWAKGLSRCGYATDPNYADRLITIIERYGLQMLYDGKSADEVRAATEYILSHLAQTHPMRRSRGLHYVIALPGDTYSSIAREFKMKKKDLLKFNDVAKDHEIRPWQEVYLQPKLPTGPAGVGKATIGEEETLHSLSQRFGITLDALKKLNPGLRDRPGEVVKLH